MNSKSTILKFVILAGITLSAVLVYPAPAYANHPCDPPNIIPSHVCNMDRFHGAPPRQIPEGWTEFILYGDPAYVQDVDTFWGPPSLRIWSSGGTFKAGIFTHVSVTPGNGYRASIAWGAPTSPETFGRQLGIDPTGGSDPNSPNIIWGPMHWGPGRILNYPPPDVNIDVRARAIGETMTVFFLVDHPVSTGNDLIFIDAIALYPDESAPEASQPIHAEPPADEPAPETAPEAQPETQPESPPPAPEAPPAARAAEQPTPIPPTPVPPTATPTSTPEPTPTATPEPTATETPLPTATATPSPTATPTWTPLPPVEATPASMFDSARMQVESDWNHSPRNRLLVVLSLFGFGGATLFGSAWMWLRRQS